MMLGSSSERIKVKNGVSQARTTSVLYFYIINSGDVAASEVRKLVDDTKLFVIVAN